MDSQERVEEDSGMIDDAKLLAEVEKIVESTIDASNCEGEASSILKSESKVNSSSPTPEDPDIEKKADDDSNWQFHKSVIACNKYMLDNNISCDVTFTVSNNAPINGTENQYSEDVKSEQFMAHKYVLISRSPVFYSMFNGEMYDKQDSIVVDDVEPDAFRQMLNYIYTDEIDLKAEDVLSLLSVSKKYLIPGLSSKCTDYLSNQLDASSVCTILNHSLIFHEEEMEKKCLEIVKNQTKLVLESEAFLQASRETLDKILNLDTMIMNEVEVFEKCMAWAKHKCANTSEYPGGDALRNVFGDLLFKFRFPDMKFTDFGRVVAPSNILTPMEELAIFRYLAYPDANPAPSQFPSQRRFNPGPFLIELADKLDFVRFGSTNINIYINSNKTIKVHKIIIGNWSGVSSFFQGNIRGISTTMLSSVCYNNRTIGGQLKHSTDRVPSRKQEWEITGDFTIKSGNSTLVMTYLNNFARFGSIAVGDVTVVNKGIVTMKNNHLNIEMRSNSQFMPVLGFEYTLVS